MRVFFAMLRRPNLLLPGSEVWHANLYLPLLDLGHEVVRFDYDYEGILVEKDEEKRRAMREDLAAKLLESIADAHRTRPIDLFFSYFYDAMCDPETIREIRRLGIVTANWNCNASYQLDQIEKISPAFDFCWVPEKFRLDDYRAIGANPLYVQEAANPNFYRPYPLRKKYGVGFIGQRYGDRAEYMNRLYAAGLDAHAWGPGWARQVPSPFRKPVSRAKGRIREFAKKRLPWLPWYRCHPVLSDEDLVKTFSRCKINLGFMACGATHLDEAPILQVRLRDFEAPMCGGFYMTQHFDELTEFFEPDREIALYRDADDLIDKCRYYLRHPREREAIARAGRRRALAEHTWQIRMRNAFRQMGLPDS